MDSSFCLSVARSLGRPFALHRCLSPPQHCSSIYSFVFVSCIKAHLILYAILSFECNPVFVVAMSWTIEQTVHHYLSTAIHVKAFVSLSQRRRRRHPSLSVVVGRRIET